MSDVLAPEHLTALGVIAVAVLALVVAARRSPGRWLKVLAIVLVVDEVSWWVYLLAGGVPGSKDSSVTLDANKVDSDPNIP